MTLDYLKIILALLLFWPRGYVLVYLIDRSRSFSFGFKFFAGWLLGLAGFSLDIFATSVFGGVKFGPWLFIISSVSQIFGFGFMIFLFERKVPWPDPRKLIPFIKRQGQIFSAWANWEKFLLLIFLVTLLLRVSASFWQIANIPTYDFDAWNNWNFKAKVIYTEGAIPLTGEGIRLGGGIFSYPLNDALLKVWLSNAVGSFEDRYINLMSIFYYLMLLGLFYFMLPPGVNRGHRFLATYALSSLPLLYFHSHVPYADLLFAVFLLMAVGSMFSYLAGRGNSFYYLSGMGLAFSIWTKNEGLTILLPLMILTTVILLLIKKISLKDFLLQWFFAVLTVSPWLYFRTINRLHFLSGDSSDFSLVFNQQFIGDIFSGIFLRSHFNILWILALAFIVFRFKDIYRDFSLRYLTITLVALFLIYNGIILFTDKALDLSALARINMQLAPLGVLALTFYFSRLFGQPPRLFNRGN